MFFTLLIGGAVAMALIYFLITYNGLVTLKNNVGRAWSNIDVLLKQRFDELPKLVSVCERYIKHEKDTLEGIARARSMVANANGQAEVGEAQNMLSGALKSLFAVVENYPELKADKSFAQLQGRISSLENEIADRREYFNDSVNVYNIGIEKLPDVFVAKLLNYKPRQMWKINSAQRESVAIKFGA